MPQHPQDPQDAWRNALKISPPPIQGLRDVQMPTPPSPPEQSYPSDLGPYNDWRGMTTTPAPDWMIAGPDFLEKDFTPEPTPLPAIEGLRAAIAQPAGINSLKRVGSF